MRAMVILKVNALQDYVVNVTMIIQAVVEVCMVGQIIVIVQIIPYVRTGH